MLTSELIAGSPAPGLRGDVLGYVGYAQHSPVPHERREPPGTEVHLILSLGPRMEVDGHERTSFVAALDPGPATTRFVGDQHGVEVRLTPLATHRLLGGVPMEELCLPVVALDDLLGAEAGLLVEQLAETDWRGRFALLDRVVAARLDAGPPVPVELGWALGALGRGMSAGAVARELGWSDRRLLRAFRRCVGVPPTVYGRIVRFRRSTRLLGTMPLADAALSAGYYDQAHMTRDFRQFAGVTPGAYVGSVQDAA